MKLEWTEPDRVELLTVKLGKVERVELLTVKPVKPRLAPVPTLSLRGQTLWRTVQQSLRGAFLGVSGDLIENSAFDAPGPTQPSGRPIQIRGWTSMWADPYAY